MLTIFRRDPRPPSPSRLLSGLRPVPGWVITGREPGPGTVNPAWDPCGRPAPPFKPPDRRKKVGGKTAATRRAAS